MSLPSKLTIAEHWSHHTKTYVCDIGEPTCFACGNWFNGSYDSGPLKSRWDRAPLERCHIVAKQFGGDDSASNIILLCKECHRDQPDVPSYGAVMEWVDGRENWVVKRMREIRHCLSLLTKGSPENFEPIFRWAMENIDVVDTHCGVHFGVRFKVSTFLFAMQTAYEETHK